MARSTSGTNDKINPLVCASFVNHLRSDISALAAESNESAVDLTSATANDLLQQVSDDVYHKPKYRRDAGKRSVSARGRRLFTPLFHFPYVGGTRVRYRVISLAPLRALRMQ